MKTPVVLIIFNRPETTSKIFAAVREAKPQKLLIIADGPRSDRPEEAKLCELTRAIIEQVDWHCEVSTNYSEVNLGCAKRVSSGLDWAFDEVDQAIILEDDCLPHPSFFRFCEELLDYYKHDQRVFSISGQNVQFGRQRTQYSYYFSHYNHCWGWASWRRAWQYYDFDMSLWPEIQLESSLKDIVDGDRAFKFWTKTFQATHDRSINSWAYRWLFAAWTQNGLTILPDKNLISNIGFNTGATHTRTTKQKSRFANMSVEGVEFPLVHPPLMIRNRQADNFTQETLFSPGVFTRAKSKIERILSS